MVRAPKIIPNLFTNLPKNTFPSSDGIDESFHLNQLKEKLKSPIFLSTTTPAFRPSTPSWFLPGEGQSNTTIPTNLIVTTQKPGHVYFIPDHSTSPPRVNTTKLTLNEENNTGGDGTTAILTKKKANISKSTIGNETVIVVTFDNESKNTSAPPPFLLLWCVLRGVLFVQLEVPA